MKKGENHSAHQLLKILHACSKFDFIFLIDLNGEGGGEQISVKSFVGLVYVMLIWFVMAHNCLGGRGVYFYSYFFFTIYTYKLLQAISPKALVENSSARWAFFSSLADLAMVDFPLTPDPVGASLFLLSTL